MSKETIWLNVKPIVIHDEINKNHVVLSLSGMGKDEQISISPPGPGLYPKTNVTVDHISSKAMLELGFNSAAAVRTRFDSEMMFRVWNFLRFRREDNTAPGSAIIRSEWGIGARIGVTGWNLSGELGIGSLNGLAAATSLGMASSIYDIQLFGAGIESLRSIRDLLANAYGSFNLDQIELIGRSQQALVNYFSENEALLVPKLLRVEIDPSKLDNFYPEMSAMCGRSTAPYVMERVYAKKTLGEAVEGSHFLNAESQGVTKESVERMYLEIFNLKEGEQVTQDHRDIAWDKLWTGRIN